MALDTAGNSIQQATRIRLTAQPKGFRDTVGGSDRNDFYRFRVSQRRSFNLVLKGLKANANVQLLNRDGNLLQASANPGTQNETIFRALNAGVFYIRVRGQKAETRYNLRLSAVLDQAGETLASARDLGVLGTATVTDWVGNSDLDDFYAFQVREGAGVTVGLNGLRDNGDLQLLDSAGEVIQSSATVGNTAESIQTTLAAGTYYARVLFSGTAAWGSNYQLQIATTPSSPDPLPDSPDPLPGSPDPLPSPPALLPNSVGLRPLVAGFSEPTHITNAGDGSDRLFVVQKGGTIQILKNGVALPTAFLDIGDRLINQGEQGLLSVAFPQNYETTGNFYVYYTNKDGDNVVSRFQTSANADQAIASSEQIVLTIPHPVQTNHNGGHLAFGADGYLYIAPGDGGGSGDPNNNAQNPRSLLGKVLRIDVGSPGVSTYTIPSTNPFVGSQDPTDLYRDEIWALGLRNPWRFSFDRLTQDLYIADVGQNAFEEVNFQPASSPGGENYGWKILEASTRYNNSTASTDGLVLPVAEYPHAQGRSITGGYVYRGSDPTLQGIYFYGDFVNGKLWGLRREGNLWENKLLLDSAYGISTFGEDEAGNLYVADYFGGGIYQLTAA